jgi:phycocyanobilin:ferredoxin oxidoreductase
MSSIWENLINCKDEILNIFDQYATEVQEKGLTQFNQPENGWINRVWANKDVRRAHIDVVDARESKGLWMMHVCCFPVLTNDAPIYGFDVIAGKNKMTGAFHDFSPSPDYDHPLVQWYEDAVKDYVPTKKRELPEWAKNIFTDSMIAAGNVNTDEEAQQIIDLALSNLRVWFESVPEYTGNQTADIITGAQNWYCHNQQQNPHTPRVMKSLGLNESDVELFCTDALFPKIN